MDTMIIGIIALVFAIYIVVGHMTLGFVKNTAIDVTPPGGSEGIITSVANNFLVFDSMFLVLIIFLTIGAVAAATVVRTRPVFLVVDLFLLGLIIFIGAALTNVYMTFASVSQVVTSASAFPNILFIMQHLPHYLALIGALITIAFYAKGRQDASYGGSPFQ